MNFKPRGDLVLLNVPDLEKTTSSGLIINNTDSIISSTVVACGDGISYNGKKIPLDVKEGDKVMFNRKSASDIIVENVKYLLIKEENIIGIVN